MSACLFGGMFSIQTWRLVICARDVADFYRDPVNDDRIDAIVFLSQQRFAAEF